MTKAILTLILTAILCSGVYASDSIVDLYGIITSVDLTPIISKGGGENGDSGGIVGYRRSITMQGKTYPMASKMMVSRLLNPPAMYPKAPAKLSDVQQGKLVNLRLSGHSVIEVVLQEK